MMVSGHAGEQVTLVGKPETVTETDVENPFRAEIETVTAALVVPAWVLTDDGETEIEKSGAGGGGFTDSVGVGVTVTGDDMPPPEMFTGMVICVPPAAVTFPVTVMTGKLALAASESLRVHVSDERAHVQPVPEMPVTVKPVGGSETVTAPLVAAFPALETAMV